MNISHLSYYDMSGWGMLRTCAYCGTIYGSKPGTGKTHGICTGPGSCYERVMSEIRELKKRQKWGGSSLAQGLSRIRI